MRFRKCSGARPRTGFCLRPRLGSTIQMPEIPGLAFAVRCCERAQGHGCASAVGRKGKNLELTGSVSANGFVVARLFDREW